MELISCTAGERTASRKGLSNGSLICTEVADQLGLRAHAQRLTQVFHSPVASHVNFSIPLPFHSLLFSYELPD